MGWSKYQERNKIKIINKKVQNYVFKMAKVVLGVPAEESQWLQVRHYYAYQSKDSPVSEVEVEWTLVYTLLVTALVILVQASTVEGGGRTTEQGIRHFGEACCTLLYGGGHWAQAWPEHKRQFIVCGYWEVHSPRNLSSNEISWFVSFKEN